MQRWIAWIALGVSVTALAVAWLLRGTLFPQPLPALTGIAAWPMWGQNPQRNGRSPFRGPARPSIAWKRQLSLFHHLDFITMRQYDIADSIILGDQGALYFAYGGGSLARLQDVGQFRWRRASENYPEFAPALLPDGDIVYGYGGLFSGISEVVCYSPAGEMRWKYTPRCGKLGSGALVDSHGTIFITEENIPFFTKTKLPSRLTALSPQGQVLWSCETEPDLTSELALNWREEIILVGFEHVFCVSPTGKLLWKMQPSIGPNAGSGAAIADDGRILFIAEEGRRTQWEPVFGLICLDAQGTELWAVPLSERGDTPAITSGGLAVLTQGERTGYVMAVNAAGKETWRYQTNYGATASPSIDADGVIYVNAYNAIVALNADGKRLWDFPLKLALSTTPTISADEALYLGSWDGEIIALRADER